MTAPLVFKHIVLISPARNYTVDLSSGINVIMGPIFTGKSSVLELIDYVLGAKNPINYAEIKKCSDVLVELSVAGETMTIKRSLASITAKPIIFSGSVADVMAGRQLEKKEVSWKHEKGKESLSSEILDRLGLGEIEVKAAPTQDASETNIFSMRDLLRLLYIKQSRMGARPGFFEEDFSKHIKWKAGFEIVHGLYDPRGTHLSKLLKEAKDQKKELEQELAIVQKFLNDSEVPGPDDLARRLEDILAEREKMEAKIAQQKSDEIEQLGVQSQLLDQREELEWDSQRYAAQRTELDRTLVQLGKLRVQYERELAQLDFLRESTSILSPLPVVRCPACFQDIVQSLSHEECYACHKALPAQTEHAAIDAQVRSLQNRISDLEKYTSELTKQRDSVATAGTTTRSSLAQLDKSIELIRKRTVFPKDRQLLESAEALSRLDKEEEMCRRNLALRHRSRGEGSALLALQERINHLQGQLASAKQHKPHAGTVIKTLSVHFSRILASFRFPWSVDDAHLDDGSFLPVVRGQDYKEIRSNGAIALIQCAWEMALLEYSLELDNSLFPRFLMLDSPLNHVGRDDSDPEFRDQQIVDAFYRYFMEFHDKYSNQVQVLICDNKPPASGRALVRLEYTGKPDQGRYGLIDDEIAPQRPS